MAEQFLDGPDVVALLQQVCGEGVTEGMAGGRLGNAGRANRVLYSPLEHRFVEMVAAPLASKPVDVGASRREDPVPAPLAAGVRVLAREGAGQFDPTGFVPQVSLVLLAHPLDVGRPVPP